MKNIILILALLTFLPCSWANNDLDFLLKNSSYYKSVKIEEVRSVNTFMIKNQNNAKEIIHLIGLKEMLKPKSIEKTEYDQYGFPVKKDNDLETNLEEDSFDAVVELLKGKTVKLEFDSEKKDADDQTWAYAFIVNDNTFINAEILRLGYADLQIQAPNFKYSQKLREAYQEAKKEKRGIQAQ